MVCTAPAENRRSTGSRPTWLAAWTKVVESGPPQAGQLVSQTLQHWKADADLAVIRDDAALAKLPADEQKACATLLAEVDTLLAKADAHARTAK